MLVARLLSRVFRKSGPAKIAGGEYRLGLATVAVERASLYRPLSATRSACGHKSLGSGCTMERLKVGVPGTVSGNSQRLPSSKGSKLLKPILLPNRMFEYSPSPRQKGEYVRRHNTFLPFPSSLTAPLWYECISSSKPTCSQLPS